MAEKSRISGGGTRYTTKVPTTDLIGRDESYVRTEDYDKYGNFISGTHTDAGGNIWSTDKSGTPKSKIGKN